MSRPPAQRTDANLSAIESELRRLGASDELCVLILGLLGSMDTKNRALQLRLDAALRQLFAKRSSEKVSTDQLALFLAKLPIGDVAPEPEPDASGESPGTPDDGTGGEVVPPPPKRPPPKKHAFPAHLPRRAEIIRVPEADRICACGEEKTFIGFEVQATWEYDPAQFYLLEKKREKLACKSHEEDGVVTAPAPGKPIDGGRPGASLLAQIVTAKEHDSLPLYRQSTIYKRAGIHLAPSTLGDWHAAAADLYEPIWKALRSGLLTSHLISVDDTSMPVLDRDDPRGIKKGHIWTYLGDQNRVAFCDFTPTWSGEAATRLLKESKARVVQGDGYKGIEEVFKGIDPPKRAGCADHARRGFVKAFEAGDLGAALVVKVYQDLYAVEAKARAEGLDDAALLARRQEQCRPLMDKLKRLIAELHPSAVPKSLLGKATGYAVRQWPTLQVFLDDPRVPLSNAHVERQQRRTALGRKNYLFAGNDEAARRLAILQTVVVNCDLLKISMWHYLRDTYERLAAAWPHSRLAELTPAAWAAQQKEQQASAQ